MKDKEILELLIKEFSKIDKKFDNLENRFDNLENRFDNLENRFDNLENRFDNLEIEVKDLKTIVNRIDNNLIKHEKETENKFIHVEKYLDQAFEKISENFEYQDKVNDIVKILKTPRNISPKSRLVAQSF